MDTEILQQVGLNKSEVKVYLTLLELGSSTTGPIMHKAKVSSSKIYGILARLIEKGLVSFIVKGKTKHYQASKPESLKEYINEKMRELKTKEQQILDLIPHLKLKQKLSENKQEAQVYLGWKGIMNAFDFVLENLKKGDDYIAFSQPKFEEESKGVKLFFTKYQQKREELRLNVKLIADNSQKKIFNSLPYTKFKNFEARYVENCPPGIIIFNDYILVTAFEIAPVAVIIQSKQIADSYRKYFYDSWKVAEKN